jgi:PAS domain S-box-containing protein
VSERNRIDDAASPMHAGAGRRIDQELEESEARYRTLFEQSPLGVFTYDRDLRLTDCNAAFVRLLKSTYEKLRGLDLRLLRDHRMPPVLERVLDGEPMLYEGEYDATTSRAKVAIAMWLTPLRSAEGDVVGGIGIVEDVTLQRAARDAIARSEANFRALVEQRDRRLSRQGAGGPCSVTSRRSTSSTTAGRPSYASSATSPSGSRCSCASSSPTGSRRSGSWPPASPTRSTTRWRT